MSKSILVEVKANPNTKLDQEIMRIDQNSSRMDLIVSNIWDRILPTDKVRARKIRSQTTTYTLIDEVLYRRGYTLPFSRCLDKEEADYILRKIHEGVCRNHPEDRSLALKALKQGYFWPTMPKDSQEKNQDLQKLLEF